MVYVPAGRRHEYPDIPWQQFQRRARALKRRCSDDPHKWLSAEYADEAMALWAAAVAKCRRGNGLWVLEDYAQKRAGVARRAAGKAARRGGVRQLRAPPSQGATAKADSLASRATGHASKMRAHHGQGACPHSPSWPTGQPPAKSAF